MASESVATAPSTSGPKEWAQNEEQALWVVDAALWMHRKSFGLDGEDKIKAEWLITSAMERAVQLLKADVYGEA